MLRCGLLVLMFMHSTVCVLVIQMSLAKRLNWSRCHSGEGQTCMGPRYHVLDGVRIGATWRMWLNNLCSAVTLAIDTITVAIYYHLSIGFHIGQTTTIAFLMVYYVRECKNDNFFTIASLLHMMLVGCKKFIFVCVTTSYAQMVEKFITIFVHWRNRQHSNDSLLKTCSTNCQWWRKRTKGKSWLIHVYLEKQLLNGDSSSS